MPKKLLRGKRNPQNLGVTEVQWKRSFKERELVHNINYYKKDKQDKSNLEVIVDFTLTITFLRTI